MGTNNNLLYEDVQLDAQVKINACGDNIVAPLPWEVVEKSPIMVDDKVKFRASVTLSDDGTAEIRRYRTGTRKPLYQIVYQSEHCDVLVTRAGNLIERWRFGKRMKVRDMYHARKRERREVDAFFKAFKDLANG